MGKRRRKDGTEYIVYRAQVRDPRRAKTDNANIEQTFSAQRYGAVKARKEAHKWVQAQLAAIEADKWRDPETGAEPLKNVIAEWRQTWERNLARKTQASYSAILRKHIEPRWKTTRVDAITATDIQAWVDDLAKTHEPQTVHNAYTVLRGVLKFAVRRNLIVANPCTPDAIELPSKTKRRRPTPQRYLEADELATLIDALPEHWRTPTLVAGWCGLRAGELWALRRKDVDLLHNELHIEHALKDISGHIEVGSTKTSQTRSLSIENDPELQRALKAALENPGNRVRAIKRDRPSGYPAIKDGELDWTKDVRDTDRLLFTTPGGQPVSHGNFYARVFVPTARATFPERTKLAEARAKAAGRDPEKASPVRFHDLRHTSASFTLEVAGNVEAALTIVQKRLGHKNIATTADIYGHLTKQADRNVAGGLAQLRASARSAKP